MSTAAIAVCVCGWTTSADDSAAAQPLADEHRAERGHAKVRVYPMSELEARAMPNDNLMDTIARCVREDLID